LKADLTGEATIAPITAQASKQAVRNTLVFVCSMRLAPS